jgi:hypothetical protein
LEFSDLSDYPMGRSTPLPNRKTPSRSDFLSPKWR